MPNEPQTERPNHHPRDQVAQHRPEPEPFRQRHRHHRRQQIEKRVAKAHPAVLSGTQLHCKAVVAPRRATQVRFASGVPGRRRQLKERVGNSAASALGRDGLQKIRGSRRWGLFLIQVIVEVLQLRELCDDGEVLDVARHGEALELATIGEW